MDPSRTPFTLIRATRQEVAAVARQLLQRRESLALAESCTGGLLSAALTAVPGSSAYFLGSVVCYGNASKQRLLGVPAATLGRYGAVSAAVAKALASGARARFGADWSLAITGVAGPSGGS
ncbi:MAG: CinA family protein, partial [Terriglobales bacterium]